MHHQSIQRLPWRQKIGYWMLYPFVWLMSQAYSLIPRRIRAQIAICYYNSVQSSGPGTEIGQNELVENLRDATSEIDRLTTEVLMLKSDIEEAQGLSQEVEKLTMEKRALITQITNLQTQMFTLEVNLEQAKKDGDESLRRLSELMSSRLRDNNPNIADLDDMYRPTKLADIYSEIYDNEWTAAFEHLEASQGEPEIIALLLDVIMEAHMFCVVSIQKQWEIIKQSVLWDMDGVRSADTFKWLKDARKSHALTMLPRIQVEFESELKKLSLFGESEAENGDIKDYVQSCVRVCWLMSVQDPPVVLECPEWCSRMAVSQASLVEDQADLGASHVEGLTDSQANLVEGQTDSRASHAECQADSGTSLVEGQTDSRASHVEGQTDSQASHVESQTDSQASHVEGQTDSQASHVEGQTDSQASHVEGQTDSQASHVEGQTDSQASHVEDLTDSRASHVEDLTTGSPSVLEKSPTGFQIIHDASAMLSADLAANKDETVIDIETDRDVESLEDAVSVQPLDNTPVSPKHDVLSVVDESTNGTGGFDGATVLQQADQSVMDFKDKNEFVLKGDSEDIKQPDSIMQHQNAPRQEACVNGVEKRIPENLEGKTGSERDDNGTKAVRIEFDRELFREYTSKGKYVEFFVWPAMYLCKDGALLKKGVAQGCNK